MITNTDEALDQEELRVLISAIEALAADRQQLNEKFGRAVAKAIQFVLDGKDGVDCLEGVEKTTIGTKVEKILLEMLGLPSNTSQSKNELRSTGAKCLDTYIAGHPVDIKYSGHYDWMIPNEAHNHWCLVIGVNYQRNTFSYGLAKARPEYFRPSKNQDEKRQFSAAGKRKAIYWFAHEIDIPNDRDFQIWSIETDFSRITNSLSTILAEQPRHGMQTVDTIPASPGVYALYQGDEMVYVGKAVAKGGLKARADQHRTKISEATLISNDDISIQFMACDPNLATGLEGFLISRHGTPWNGSGFGSKVAGKGRPNQKTAAWDIEYGRAQA